MADETYCCCIISNLDDAFGVRSGSCCGMTVLNPGVGVLPFQMCQSEVECGRYCIFRGSVLVLVIEKRMQYEQSD